MIVLLLAGLGLIFGSFVNALVWRLHEHRNWVNERSECSNCHHVLAPKDLVPVVSWLSLKGRCRYCGHIIEDSPLVELTTSLVFVCSYAFWPLPLHGSGLLQFGAWLLCVVIFMALLVYDVRWFLLPNKLVYPLIAISVIFVLIPALFFDGSWHQVLSAAVGAVVMSGLFYVLFQMSKGEWIGGGDVKIAIALGLLSGGPLQAALLLFFASMIGVLFSLPQLIQKKRKAMTIKVPFGPFLILATIIVELCGSGIVDWYTRLFTA